MKKYIIILLINLVACNKVENEFKDSQKLSNSSKTISLVHTTWQAILPEDGLNYLIFNSDSSYYSINCEMKDVYYGIFYFKEDTLILDEKNSMFYNDSTRMVYYTEIKENKLRYIKMHKYYWYKKSYKVFDDFVEEYYYTPLPR